jgi:hypothetical protein
MISVRWRISLRYFATPLAPSLASSPAETHLRLNAAIGAHLAPLLRDGKNIAIARTLKPDFS